jgi:hypothetical protein
MAAVLEVAAHLELLETQALIVDDSSGPVRGYSVA